eukprot:241330-Heterocapsa_arctica.AAC.1
METRTTTMDHIMVISEMGAVCNNFDNLEAFQTNKKGVCGLSAKCLMCKGLNDVKDLEAAYNDGHTAGMKKWIDIMQTNQEWMSATTTNKFFMVCAHLSTPAMRQERKDVSQYGAVRMSKTETNEM